MARRRAFTVIELMVVVGILALLIAITIPVIAKAREAAKDSATKQLMSTLSTQLEQYGNEQSGNYPPDRLYFTAPPATAALSLGNAESLAQGLTGYLDGTYDGAGSPYTKVDGTVESNFGFRNSRGGKGKVYGPYGAMESKSYRAYGSGYAYVDARTAKDVTNHGILYFRAVPQSNSGVSRAVTSVFAASTVSYPDQTFTGIFGYDTALLTSDPSAGTADFFTKIGGTTNSATGVGTIAGRDGYLLVASGADEKYFTKDDVIQSRP